MNRNTQHFLLCILSALLAGCMSTRWNASGGYSERWGWRKYDAAEFLSIAQVPSAARVASEQHLRNHVGDLFLTEMSFYKGTRRDLPVDNSSGIPAFSLYYAFSAKSKGLRSYYVRVDLDSEGNLLNTLDIPDIQNAPEKANVVSLDTIISKLETMTPEGERFIQDPFTIDVSYDRDLDAILYKILSIQEQRPPGVLMGTRFTVNAHTGIVLATETINEKMGL